MTERLCPRCPEYIHWHSLVKDLIINCLHEHDLLHAGEECATYIVVGMRTGINSYHKILLTQASTRLQPKFGRNLLM